MNQTNEEYSNQLHNLKESNIKIGDLKRYECIIQKYPLIYQKAEELKNQYSFKRIAEAFYWIMNDITELPHCPYHTHPECNDRPLFVSYNQGYRNACPFCGRKNPDIIQKQKEGCLKKYGVENAMLSKEIKDKQSIKLKEIHEKYGFGTEHFKNTMVEKYGVENPAFNEELKKKSIENKARTLSDPVKRANIIRKKQQTEINKYGDIFVRTSLNKNKSSITHTNKETYRIYKDRMLKEFKEFNIELLEDLNWGQDIYPYKCTKCNTVYNTDEDKLSLTRFREGKRYWCKKCYKVPGGASISEYEVGHFIQFQIPDIKIEHNRRDLIPNNYKEIDLWFPDYNIGIEFCGMIYHATFPYGLNGKGVSEDYHQNKFYLCHKNNINLITIFEHEWMSIKNRNMIKSRLMEYFGQYITECYVDKIEDIDKNTCISFLERNRYWSQFVDLTENYKGVYNEHGIMVAVLINIKDNDYIMYKLNGILIHDLDMYDFNLIQDNRYPLSFEDFTEYHDSLLWEYHNGWCVDIYKEHPDKSVTIRKINDCGYSMVNELPIT